MTLRVRVYASRKKSDTYLYVLEASDLAPVPEPLRQALAPLRQALEFELTAERTLALADPQKVRADLQSQGFYLQLPPGDGTPSP